MFGLSSKKEPSGMGSKVNGATVGIAVVTFVLAVAVFALLFSVSFDRSVGSSVALAVGPALIAAGAMVWQRRNN